MIFEGSVGSVRREGATAEQVSDKLVIRGGWDRDIEWDGVFCNKSDVSEGIDSGEGRLGSGGGIYE